MDPDTFVQSWHQLINLGAVGQAALWAGAAVVAVVLLVHYVQARGLQQATQDRRDNNLASEESV